MGLFKALKNRRVSYSIAGSLVLAVNGNALAAPVSANIQRYLETRPHVVMEKGRWDVMKLDSPVNSIHAALLRTGKVMLIAGSGNNEKEFEANSFRTVLWDPKTSDFKEIATPWDAFCAGHVFLPDGRLLVAGGTRKYEDLTAVPKQEYQGLPDSYIFDPVTEKYERVDDMEFSRWYPTLVSLPNNTVLASSGLDEKGEILYGQTEIFDIATGTWTENKDLNRYFPTYPSLLLAGDGRLFYSGSNAGYGSATQGRTPGFWDLTNNTFQVVSGLPEPELMETSSTVLLPPAQDQRVMVLGGGGIGDSPISSDRTAIIDLDSENPRFTMGPRLKDATRYPNAVILPDDTVLQSNGSRGYRTDDVLSAHIFDPKYNSFKQVASPWVGRNYHAEALLLPDGRVATFGSNPIDNSFEMRIEVYSPAYLFRGERPRISGVPATSLIRGTKASFTTINYGEIASAKLIRPSSVTHVTDVEQRSVNLPFKNTVNGIEVDIPENINLLPPGWYMAFITNTAGIPSEAAWVHVE